RPVADAVEHGDVEAVVAVVIRIGRVDDGAGAADRYGLADGHRLAVEGQGAVGRQAGERQPGEGVAVGVAVGGGQLGDGERQGGILQQLLLRDGQRRSLVDDEVDVVGVVDDAELDAAGEDLRRGELPGDAAGRLDDGDAVEVVRQEVEQGHLQRGAA